MRWYEEGTDPDYRFSLANERTYLAWIRTALAILAGAVLLKQFATGIRPQGLVISVAAALAALAGVIGVASYYCWRGNEHAMRMGRSLPRAFLLPVLAGGLALVAGAGTVLVLWP